jgi:PhnB protein
MAKARRVAKRKAKPAPRPTQPRPAKKIQPVPPGYHTVTAYLTVNDGARALDFYQRAFGARDIERMPGPGGKLMHAEFKIGDSIVMLSDEFPGMSSCKAPTSLGGTTVTMFLYVPDVDAAFKRALEAGCKVITPVMDMFWGDRFGKLEDPFGNQWSMATHKENVSPAEMAQRAQAFMSKMGGAS